MLKKWLIIYSRIYLLFFFKKNIVEFSPQHCHLKNEKYEALEIVCELLKITGTEAD